MIFSWERYFQWTWVVVKDTQQPDVDTIASTSLEPIPTPCPHLSHHLSPSWSHCHHLLCCDNILAHFPWLLSPLTHPRTILLVTFKTYICLHLSAAQKPLEPPPPVVYKVNQIKPLIIILLQPIFLKHPAPFTSSLCAWAFSAWIPCPPSPGRFPFHKAASGAFLYSSLLPHLCSPCTSSPDFPTTVISLSLTTRDIPRRQGLLCIHLESWFLTHPRHTVNIWWMDFQDIMGITNIQVLQKALEDRGLQGIRLRNFHGEHVGNRFPSPQRSWGWGQ